MTLDQLRIFLEVAARQHVTRAAEVLHLTQSAVSAAIAALEARHAVKLFDRIGRRIELTEAGRLFVPEAQAVLTRAQAAELVLADLSGKPMGTVRLHASQTVANYWLPQRLVRLRETFPAINIELHVSNTAQVARAVVEGVADVGVVEGAATLPDLEKSIVARDRLILVVGRDHPWAGRRSVRVDELCRTSWILREAGSGTRSEFEDALTGLGMRLKDLPVLLELPSNEAVLAAVATSASATVLSERAARPELVSGRLAVVDLDLPVRDFLALRHRQRYVTRAAQTLLDVLERPDD